jgi:DHA1 family inner membrane transport protein
MSLHSLFFFMGHSAGPVLYTLGFAYLGASASVMIGGAVMLLVGLLCARFLRRRRGDV